MDPDERIENLLNRAGQTISDLPTQYDFNSCVSCRDVACKWTKEHHNERAPLTQYTCHLADIIDRLEIALENALTRNGEKRV